MLKKKLIIFAAIAGLVFALAPAVQTHAGTVAHWKMDGDANDSVGSFNATEVNSPDYATGRIGQAIDLNGTDQRADVVGMGEYAQVSISVWINASDPDAAGLGAIFHHNEYNNSSHPGQPYTPHFFIMNWNSPTLDSATVSLDYGGPNVYGFDSIKKDTWHHLAWTYKKDAALTLYVDGAEVDSDTASFDNMSLSDMGIGGVTEPPPWGGDGRYFDGMIDDLAVWDEALSPDDIELIYNGGLQGIDAVTALVGAVPGDTNGDDKVDLYDLDRFENQFGGPPSGDSADFDNNGIVDLDDFAIIRGNWNFGVVPTAPEAAPEPATMSLLALGGLMALRRRRQRVSHG